MSNDKKIVGEIQDFKKSWVLVTGASRGFGASICKILAPKLAEGSVIVGLARNTEGLQKTKEIVSTGNNGIEVYYEGIVWCYICLNILHVYKNTYY